MKVRNQVKGAMSERLSLRGVARIFGLSRRTVSLWLVQWISQVPAVASKLLPAEAEDVFGIG